MWSGLVKIFDPDDFSTLTMILLVVPSRSLTWEIQRILSPYRQYALQGDCVTSAFHSYMDICLLHKRHVFSSIHLASPFRESSLGSGVTTVVRVERSAWGLVVESLSLTGSNTFRLALMPALSPEDNSFLVDGIGDTNAKSSISPGWQPQGKIT